METKATPEDTPTAEAGRLQAMRMINGKELSENSKTVIYIGRTCTNVLPLTPIEPYPARLNAISERK